MLLIQNELFFSDAKPNTSLFLGGGVDVAAYVWEHLKKTIWNWMSGFCQVAIMFSYRTAAIIRRGICISHINI